MRIRSGAVLACPSKLSVGTLAGALSVLLLFMLSALLLGFRPECSSDADRFDFGLGLGFACHEAEYSDCSES
jgi:hypothetical protein